MPDSAPQRLHQGPRPRLLVCQAASQKWQEDDLFHSQNPGSSIDIR